MCRPSFQTFETKSYKLSFGSSFKVGFWSFLAWFQWFQWFKIQYLTCKDEMKRLADRPRQSPIEQCVTVTGSPEDVVTFSNISEKTESPLCGKATAFLCWHGGDSLPISHKGGMQIKQWKGRGACLQHGCNKDRSRRNPSSVGTNRC